MIPSSDQMASDSSPSSSRIRALRARPQAAWTRPAEGREHAQPPVADLIAEALDHDRAVGRHDPRRGLLLAQELDQVGGRPAVEVVVALQHLGVLVDGPAGERADGLAELARPPHAVALPERDGTRQPGGRGDDHPVASDLLDPPGARPEQEGLARPGLIDHLLVQLADPAPVGQSHRVEAAVGDRARVGDRRAGGRPGGPGSCP